MLGDYWSGDNIFILDCNICLRHMRDVGQVGHIYGVGGMRALRMSSSSSGGELAYCSCLVIDYVHANITSGDKTNQAGIVFTQRDYERLCRIHGVLPDDQIKI